MTCRTRKHTLACRRGYGCTRSRRSLTSEAAWHASRLGLTVREAFEQLDRIPRPDWYATLRGPILAGLRYLLVR